MHTDGANTSSIGDQGQTTTASADTNRPVENAEGILARRTRLAALRGDIGIALAAAPDVPHALQGCAEAIVHNLNAAFARIWSLSKDGGILELQASAGLYTHTNGPHARVPVGKFKIGLIAQERLPHLTNDVHHDPRVSNQEWARSEGMVAFAGYPLLVEDRLVGVLALFARQPLAEDTLEALAAVADIIAQAVERKHAEAALLQAHAELEDRVRERTAELAAANTALQRSNRELEQFAYVASHDLQEPLRKILAFGDRLLAKFGDRLDEQGKDYLSRMQGAAARMRSLIDDLLTFSRLATHPQPFRPLALGNSAREALSDIEDRLHQTGGQVTLGDLPTVEADPTQMRQLFQNLFSNALKFHRPGVTPTVQIAAQVVEQSSNLSVGSPPGPWCEIRVVDNGIGFEQQYAERIFQIFQRLHGRTEYEGTGIGLAVCRKIVERHGGAIFAQSEPGHGTTFIVILPMRQAPGDRNA